MKVIAQQAMKDNGFTIDDVREELQRIRTKRISSVMGLDKVKPIQITNGDAEDMNNDLDFFQGWYESELNKLVDELECNTDICSSKESFEIWLVETNNKYEIAWNELSDESIKLLNKLVDDLDNESIKEPKARLEQSLFEMNQIREGQEKGKSWREIHEELKTDAVVDKLWAKAEDNLRNLEAKHKDKLNSITANAKLLEGKDGMIELDPTNKSHVEWFEDDSYEDKESSSQ
ncbi:hypothetical protein [Paenibacillus silvae]|uniref:Uncharacterized protein n=1 Tax=Paenibacillus silvae TaxID=1325358 RepID=A0A2W6PCR1_9BACL|nr:hypothetical protein [Paenibacillus silvae]PZT57450.1 hypothetical protein DN757_01995 [Paenibacillus silvae]